MKVSMICARCVAELTPEAKAAMTSSQALMNTGEILEGGIVRAVCPAGHKKSYALMDPLFELMFEMAASALLDGYYREAVLGITTALERFYEFCVRVVAYRQGVPPDAFEKGWAGVNRSERQLGAFTVCYLLDTKRPFNAKPIGRFTELRNNVAHEGYIPTREEAVDYGNVALAEIHRILNDLFPDAKNDGAPELRLVLAVLVGERRALLKGEPAATLGRSTAVSAAAPYGWGAKTFSQWLDEMRLAQVLFVNEEAGSGTDVILPPPAYGDPE